MGNHRKINQYRRILIGAVAVGVVGVPSVAVARADWPGPSGGGQQSSSAANTSATNWWNDTTWRRDWNRGTNQQWPTAKGGNPASATPPTSAPQPPTTAPGSPTSAPEPPAPTAGTQWAGAPGSWGGPPTGHDQRPVPPHHRTPPPGAPTSGPSTPAPDPTPSASDSSTPASDSSTPSATPSPAPSDTASATADRIVQLVNAERSKAGCSDLTLNSTLSKAAQAHSDDMASHQNMSHTGSDGTSPGDRITQAGYTWSAYGENVAYGYSTPEQVMAAWMSSPGHKANILNCGFKDIGVGLAQPGSYWTQDFGTPQ